MLYMTTVSICVFERGTIGWNGLVFGVFVIVSDILNLLVCVCLNKYLEFKKIFNYSSGTNWLKYVENTFYLVKCVVYLQNLQAYSFIDSNI